MKGWNEYFENQDVNDTEKLDNINEHHKETKEEKIEWICGVLPEQSDEIIDMIYRFVEKSI
jgi:hypothetical protein